MKILQGLDYRILPPDPFVLTLMRIRPSITALEGTESVESNPISLDELILCCRTYTSATIFITFIIQDFIEYTAYARIEIRHTRCTYLGLRDFYT